MQCPCFKQHYCATDGIWKSSERREEETLKSGGALCFSLCQSRASTICLVRVRAHICELALKEIASTVKIIAEQLKAERRETPWVKAAFIPPSGCTSPLVRPWPFCPPLLEKRRTGIESIQSKSARLRWFSYEGEQRRKCSPWCVPSQPSAELKVHIISTLTSAAIHLSE